MILSALQVAVTEVTPVSFSTFAVQNEHAQTIRPLEYYQLPNTTKPCKSHNIFVERWFTFGTLQLARVLVTWILFGLSLTGNSFVLVSLRQDRKRSFIMFHFILSNLIYTIFVMPSDAIWHATMEWLAGDVACRICQMMKQFGMYASSFMVVVIGVDRVTGILCSISNGSQHKRGLRLVAVAWITSFICCLPAAFIFSVDTIPTCEQISIHQCVDFLIVGQEILPFYYFFTMFISFVLPLLSTLISYSLIVCEISNMKARDRELMGRRYSVNINSMQRAKKRTIWMRTLITLTFLLCWGPYYGKGIYDWFVHHEHQVPPGEIDTAMYIAMYLNPVFQPFVFGIFMQKVRSNFCDTLICVKRIIFKNRFKRISESKRRSFNHTSPATHVCLSPNKSFQFTTMSETNKRRQSAKFQKKYIINLKTTL